MQKRIAKVRIKDHQSRAMAVLTAALALSGSALGLLVPTGQPSTPAFDAPSSSVGQRSSRRELLTGGASLGGLALAALLPAPAHASYALYQSSYDSFQDRKATGYVPVATSDRETLAEIQRDIRKKRPQSSLRPEKAPQYCAGMTGNVSPMYENICANIGVSKADQSNTMSDAFGNANIGEYGQSNAETKAMEEKMARVRAAADAARYTQEKYQGGAKGVKKTF